MICDLTRSFFSWSHWLWYLQFVVCFYFQAQYEHHKEVRAAQGVKIIGKDLEKSLAGLPLYVAHDEDECEYFRVSTWLSLLRCISAWGLTVHVGHIRHLEVPKLSLFSLTNSNHVCLFQYLITTTVQDSIYKAWMSICLAHMGAKLNGLILIQEMLT